MVMKNRIIIIISVLVVIGIIIFGYVKSDNHLESKKDNNSNIVEQDYILDENGSLKYDSSKFIEFTDNQCIAIGYVTESNESKFEERYFPNSIYSMLDYYDFRSENNRLENHGNKYIIIPMNDKVKITVYDCDVDNNGEIKTKNTLVSESIVPFILLGDEIEYTPNMCVKFDYNGFEVEYPIVFSGENGKLDLKGYETEIKDISLY